MLGVLSLIITGSSQTDKSELCDWVSKTPPVSLEGDMGTSSKDKYWFKHLSDVDKKADTNGTKYYYVYAIKNNHPDYYLPAEWRAADIDFRRISPAGCAGNDFESSISSEEDHQAVIFYGPQKQYQKKAPLYQVKVSEEETAQPYGPTLRSRVIADLGKDGNRYRLHLEFTTAVQGTQFAYTVTNKGTKNQPFEIPTLSDEWERIRQVTQLNYEARWETSDKGFMAIAGAVSQRHIIRVGNANGLQERIVRVNIFSADGQREQIATAKIALYLPRVKR
jgi:hypothetical protein